MNNRNANHLNMLGACVALARRVEFVSVYTGKDPQAFGSEVAELELALNETNALSAQLSAMLDGASDAKADAEGNLEDRAYEVACALRSHWKKIGDRTSAGKYSYRKYVLEGMRDGELTAEAGAILTDAQSLVGNPAAVARGVTPDRIEGLAEAIAEFDTFVDQPRVGITTRSSLLRELTTRIAQHMEALRDLDDLVVQFSGTAEGRRFADAWRRTRTIVDLGTRKEEEEATPAPAVVPAPAPAPAAPPEAPVTQ